MPGENRPDAGRSRRKDIEAVAVIGLFYVVLESLGVTCPILFLTGVSCAGCGMSRAWLALLRLDLPAAFYFHPLFWLPVPVAIGFLLRRRIPPKVRRALAALVCVLFLATYFVRLLSPDDTVVVWEPAKGLLYRLLFGGKDG